eukprot:3294917-Amphidinium_carterae.1
MQVHRTQLPHTPAFCMVGNNSHGKSLAAVMLDVHKEGETMANLQQKFAHAVAAAFSCKPTDNAVTKHEIGESFRVPAACATTSDVLARTGKCKAVKMLRLPLYKDMVCQRFNTPTPSSMATVLRASSVMQRAALSWFHTPRGAFLANGALERLRCAMRTRLDLPLATCCNQL